MIDIPQNQTKPCLFSECEVNLYGVLTAKAIVVEQQVYNILHNWGE